MIAVPVLSSGGIQWLFGPFVRDRLLFHLCPSSLVHSFHHHFLVLHLQTLYCICWFSRLPRPHLSHHPWPLLVVIFSAMTSCYHRTTEPCFGHPAVLTHKTVKVKCLVKDLPARGCCMLCKSLLPSVQVTLSPKKRTTFSSLYRGSSAASRCWQPISCWQRSKCLFVTPECIFFATLYWCPSSKHHITALKFWLPSFLLCIFAILADFQPGARLLREWLSEFTSPTLPHLKKPRGVTHACVGFLLDTREGVRVKMLTSTQPNICECKGFCCKSSCA